MTTRTESATHEGWSNYPTWALNLWLSNDQGLYNQVREWAHLAWKMSDHDPCEARASLASELEGWGQAQLDEDPIAGFPGDLLGWAMGQVNWLEIARAWLAEVPGYKASEDPLSSEEVSR